MYTKCDIKYKKSVKQLKYRKKKTRKIHSDKFLNQIPRQITTKFHK